MDKCEFISTQININGFEAHGTIVLGQKKIWIDVDFYPHK